MEAVVTFSHPPHLERSLSNTSSILTDFNDKIVGGELLDRAAILRNSPSCPGYKVVFVPFNGGRLAGGLLNVVPGSRWTAPICVPIRRSINGAGSAAAVALGSLGGRAGGHKGGRARAANLTPEELSAIGRKGAAAKRAKAEERRRQKLADARGRGRMIPDEDSSPDDGLIVPGKQVAGDDW